PLKPFGAAAIPHQVLSFVGAMRALGSPADLISNIGGGAKALVYAPAQGLVQGPAEFFEGVGRGAHSFVKGDTGLLLSLSSPFSISL
ncbi:unnamed protein product, partial [Ectocarpus sp. 12 AP-2014]